MKGLDALHTSPSFAVRAALALPLVAAVGCDSGNPAQPDPMSDPVNTEYRVQDLTPGTGDPTAITHRVFVNLVNWRFDPNGVDGKGEEIFRRDGQPLVVGDTSLPVGLNLGMIGEDQLGNQVASGPMREGGLRRIHIPGGLAEGLPIVTEVELVITTPPPDIAFRFEDIVVGTGAELQAGQEFTATFAGWLYDEDMPDDKGFQFQPVSTSPLVLGPALIEGWNQGLPGMRVDGVRRLIVPPELGFGLDPQDGIPAWSTLLFEVELLSIP